MTTPKVQTLLFHSRNLTNTFFVYLRSNLHDQEPAGQPAEKIIEIKCLLHLRFAVKVKRHQVLCFHWEKVYDVGICFAFLY